MPAKPSAAPERFHLDEALAAMVGVALEQAFRELRRSVRKTLALLCTSFLAVMAAARSGSGQLSLAALYRVLPVPSRPHSRENRLRRLLDNPRLEGRAVSTGLGRLLFARTRPGLCPVLFDQTKSGAVQTLFAAVPFEGRALPLAVYTFEYPWRDRLPSQNRLEEIFLADVEQSLPPGLIPVFIGDRGYSRAQLLRQALQAHRWVLLRGRAGTMIEHAGRRRKLGELRAPPGQPLRYEGILYHARQRVPLDVVVFHEPGQAEPWYLLVPPWTRAHWTPAQVVALYRQRMQIEQSFRDFKTHLGLRGLRLQVRVAERMGRLLLAFCLAYAFLLLLGVTPEGQRARADLEIPRRQPRHGTTRTQSVLAIAMLMLSHARHVHQALQALCRLLDACAGGRAALRARDRGLLHAIGPPEK